jgi:hypothetical protein
VHFDEVKGVMTTQPMPQLAARESLAGWLSRELAAEDCRDAAIQDLSAPDAGYSGKTVFATVSWTDRTGPSACRSWCSGSRFPTSSCSSRPTRCGRPGSCPRWPASRACRFRRSGSPRPTRRSLGAPFYVMDRVRGRVPGDVPSWHRKGWTVDLTPAERTRLHDNGLAALVALHRVDWRPGLGFLDPPGAGSALDRYLGQLGGWYEWCAPSRRFGPDVLAAGLRYVLDHRPATPAKASCGATPGWATCASPTTCRWRLSSTGRARPSARRASTSAGG